MTLHNLEHPSRKTFRKAAPFCALLTCAFAFCTQTALAQETIGGIVYHDLNGNGQPDADEPGIPGVWVSNGVDIAVTDEDGHYQLAVEEHTILFVIKPRGWMTPTDSSNMAQFYTILSETGAGGTVYAGLEPTGPRPDSVDFALYPQEESDRYQALIFGDTQPRNLDEIRYIARDSIQEVIGTTDAEFGVVLGDIVFDVLDLFEPLNETVAQIGLPWYYVIGNHDIDFSADTNHDARGAWYRVYGPSWYAFTWGSVHYVLLDDIDWIVDGNDRFYRTGVGDDQLEFLANFLELVPDDELVMILAHIPWINSTAWADEGRRDRLFEILASHPHVASLAAHTHRHYHDWIGEEYGWPGEDPLHLVSMGTVGGAWWSGAHDEYGIPHSMMQDGSPTGYGFLEIDGNQWRIVYKASRRPADFQMHIHTPAEIALAEIGTATVYANVFNALPNAVVEMRVGETGEWVELARASGPDPVFADLREREQRLEEVTWRRVGNPNANPRHLWEGALPSDLGAGYHTVYVRSEDAWGVYEGRQIIRIVE